MGAVNLYARAMATSSSLQRVRAALTAAGLPAVTRRFEEGTRTVADAAAAIGVQEGQIVKSMVFTTGAGDTVLVLASGVNRVDERRVAALLGTPIERADADHVRRVTGFAIGGVPPIGHLAPLPTLLDEDLWRYDELWAAAGTPYDVFAITADQLQAATGGRRATVRR
jgi:prolyl-tRNA editing enzyme YbaK/EbsC (Cys-tRNA(Pro) deacylase)